MVAIFVILTIVAFILVDAAVQRSRSPLTPGSMKGTLIA
jgi:hypothetical protein